jgi:NitT/TauT family transport system permease protein
VLGGDASKALTIASLPMLIALWELLVLVLQPRESVLPRPSAIAALIVDEFPVLVEHTWVTTKEAVVGLALAVVVGVGLAAAMTMSKTVRALLMPTMVAFVSVPKIAFAPLFIMWLGLGYQSKMITAFLVCVFPIIVNTTGGMRQVEPDMLNLVRLMRGRRLHEFLKIRMPSALPALFDGLRIAVPLAVIGALVAEFIASSQGLGYVIISAHVHYNATLAFAAIFMIVMLSMALYAIVILAEKRLLPWRPSERMVG